MKKRPHDAARHAKSLFIALDCYGSNAVGK
jgi:hypothetical protein